MNARIILAVVIAGFVIPAAGAAASPLVFTTIDNPEAQNTYLVGINNSGVIVGNSVAADYSGRAFVYANGTFSSLVAPPGSGAIGRPSAGGISNTGAVTGNVAVMPPPNSGGGKIAGFVQTATSFQLLVLSDFGTLPHGINVAGSVVGEVDGPTPSSIGPFTFINGVRGYSSAQLSDLDYYPDIRFFGINDAGTIVGNYNSRSGVASFVLDHGATTIIRVPGAAATTADGINNDNQVVGNYVGTGSDGRFAVRGFIETAGAYLTIDVPGASATLPEAINDRGEIVGTYRDADGVSHGFLATPDIEVPEPASAVLLAGGVIALLARRRVR